MDSVPMGRVGQVRQLKIYPQQPVVVDKQNSHRTIGYFGDSFCANSTSQSSWCNVLAEKLNCGTITHWGVGGSSVWHMLLDFHRLSRENKLPEHIVIVYTEQDRIYHPNRLLPIGKAQEESETELEMAADSYLKHLNFTEKNAFQYQSSVQWFDQNTLANLSSHKITQAFSFKIPNFSLTSGKILDYTLMPLYAKNMDDGIADSELCNHMTSKQNLELAEEFAEMLK